MKRFAPPLFFAAATLLAFFKAVFHADFTLLTGGDMAAAYFPWFDVAAHWLRRGVLMLWDPYVYSGKLTMGEPQPGLFYPLNWLVMLVPSQAGGVSPDALQALLVFDFFLAGFFFYLLARSFGQTPFAAAVSGLAFSLGGFMVQLYGYVNVLGGFVWLPLALLCFRKAVQAAAAWSRVRWALGCGGALALAFLAGHHIPPIHTGLLLLFYAAWITVRDWKAVAWSVRIRPALVLAGSTVCSLAWTAHQWLPSAEWARLVYRWVGGGEPVKWGQSVPYSVLQDSFVVGPQDAISLVLPYVSTNANMYMGGIVLFFALAGLLFARRRDVGFFAAGAFVYYMLSWGRNSPLHGWLNTFVPGVWFAREVFYYLIPFQACLAMLAGWGLDVLLEQHEAGGRVPGLRTFLRRAAWVMALIVVGAGAFGALWHLDRGLPMNHPYVTGVLGLAVSLCILGFVLFLLYTGRLSAGAFRMLAVGLVLTDLSAHLALEIRPKDSQAGQDNTYVHHFWKKPRTAEYLIELGRGERFRVEDPFGIYPPNFGDAWRIDSTMGHGATALVDYFAFRGTGWGPSSNASALLNARYLLSRSPVAWAEKVLEDRETIYRNPRALPRAFLVWRYRTFARSEDLLSWLQWPLFSPGETALFLEREIERLDPLLRAGLIREQEPGRVSVASCIIQAERRAAALKDENERFQGHVLSPPWGWSAGDELAVDIVPDAGSAEWRAELAYRPGASASTRLPMRLATGDQLREFEVELPAAPGAASALKKQSVALGSLSADSHRLTVSVPDGAQARFDSLRLTTAPETPHPEDGEVLLVSHRPNSIRLDARSEKPALVVLGEVWYPGWEARVDGKPAPLLRANHILRAVAVPAGRHLVELRFRSATLQWGLGLAAVSLLGAVVLLAASRRRSSRGGRAGK